MGTEQLEIQQKIAAMKEWREQHSMTSGAAPSSISPDRQRLLENWRQQRSLQMEVLLGGGESISSIGNWFAFDKGRGITTSGVYNCVSIACAGEVGLVAHISADRSPSTENGPNSFPNLVNQIKDKGQTHLDIFGMHGDLLDEVKNYLKQKNIIITSHENKDNNSSFSIVVKGDKLEYWLDSEFDVEAHSSNRINN